MQDQDDSPFAGQSEDGAPESSEEEVPSPEEAPIKTPRKVEPEVEAPEPKEPEDNEEEDPAITFKKENAQLREELSKISDEVARLKEDTKPPEKTSGDDGDDKLLEGLTLPDDWKPKKNNYAQFANELLPKQLELTRRVIRDEVEKAQEAKGEQEKEDANVRQTFLRGVDRLRNEGKIPTVKDPDNPNDPGMKATADLMKLASRYNTVDVGKLYKDIYSKTIQKTKPRSTVSQPSKGSPDVSRAFSNKEIHGKDLWDIYEESEQGE